MKRSSRDAEVVTQIRGWLLRANLGMEGGQEPVEGLSQD
jgi:hypothetical protein